MLAEMRRFLVLGLALMLTAPAVASAEDWPASVRGLKVVVPVARAKRSHGRKVITDSVRKTMAQGLGELISPKALKKAQRKLKLRGSKRFSDKNLAAAAREAGAQWLLDIKVTKKKWLYTATARLINTETGAEQMNFRSQFYKPKKEGKDRGFRIAKRTIEKLDALTREGPLPALDGGSQDRPTQQPTAVAPPSDLTKDDVGTQPSGTADPLAQRLDDPPPDAAPADPAPTAAAATTPPPPPGDDDTELLRFSIAAGSGLLRTYSLSSDAVAASQLSYQLDPVSLIFADAEIIVPGVPVTAIFKGAFRPVGFTVDPPGQDTQRPSGSLIDASFMAGYHLNLSGQGRRAMRLVPLVGARMNVSSGSDSGGILVSSTLLAVQAGAMARLPINDVLEINLQAEGGLVASYSESPANSGTGGSGFMAAGEIGARIWLSPAIAIAFDNRFTYEQISFTGAPTRILPASEQANLQNVSVSTKDLRASIGVAFRL
jgi:hypothetical protein